ncbi:MAG: SelB C-terminal domain-containing protein [Acidobacteriota bacterium]
MNEPLLDRLAAHYEAAGIPAPAPKQAARELGENPAIVEGVVRRLVQEKRLVVLRNDLVASTAALETLWRKLLASERESFTARDVKQRLGLTSRWAIPVLEHFDAQGWTRREGAEHRRTAGGML